MTNYILDREKLKEILLAHKTFISEKCKKLIEDGIDIHKLTYGETKKFTDEFIDSYINELPVDSILDEVDEILKKITDKNTDEFLKDKSRMTESNIKWNGLTNE